eukprot:778327-Pleurochrysis_carterae.AAC.3
MEYRDKKIAGLSRILYASRLKKTLFVPVADESRIGPCRLKTTSNPAKSAVINSFANVRMIDMIVQIGGHLWKLPSI